MFRKRRIVADGILISWILEGDSKLNEAMKYIIDNYGGKIKGYLLKQSGSLEESEDAFHEGLAALIINVRKKSFKGESTISTYLTSICKGIWFKKYKRMTVHKKWEETQTSKPDHFFEDVVLTKEIRTSLDFLMSALKEKCKEVLTLWSLSYSMDEISTKLDYSSPQVVMNKKNLCLKELRKMIVENPKMAQLIV